MKRYMHKKKFNFQDIWLLRYRFYTVIVIFLITGFLITGSAAGVGDKDVDPKENNKNSVNFENPLMYSVSKNVLPTLKTEPIKKLNLGGASGINPDKKFVARDLVREVLLEKVKETVNFPVTDINPKTTDAIKVTEAEKQLQATKPEPVKPKTLDDIVAKPDTATRTNYVEYPLYNIVSPLLYATMDDLVTQDANGDFKAKGQDDINSPVQKLLQGGVVHMGYTPMPGELGNCYIVGHSSNYASVKSSYNKIFAPIERKSKIGEEFYVYDQVGRKLKFVVFDVDLFQDETK